RGTRALYRACQALLMARDAERLPARIAEVACEALVADGAALWLSIGDSFGLACVQASSPALADQIRALPVSTVADAVRSGHHTLEPRVPPAAGGSLLARVPGPHGLLHPLAS